MIPNLNRPHNHHLYTLVNWHHPAGGKHDASVQQFDFIPGKRKKNVNNNIKKRKMAINWLYKINVFHLHWVGIKCNMLLCKNGCERFFHSTIGGRQGVVEQSTQINKERGTQRQTTTATNRLAAVGN